MLFFHANIIFGKINGNFRENIPRLFQEMLNFFFFYFFTSFCKEVFLKVFLLGFTFLDFGNGKN